MKIVIQTRNTGGFMLHTKSDEWLIDCGMPPEMVEELNNGETDNRNHPLLIQLIEEIGERSSIYCDLKVIEIPDDVEWGIIETALGGEVVVDLERIWS